MDINISNMRKQTKRRIEEKEKTQIYTTKIRQYNPSLLEISERIIKQSKEHRYDIVMKYDFIIVQEKNGMKVVKTSKSKQKYVILYYKFQNHIEFYHFLFECLLTPKLLVLHIIRSYETIIESLLSLEEMKINFSSFTSHNLIFDKTSYLPIISGFEEFATLDNEVNNNVATEVVNELYLNIIETIIGVFSLENTLLNELSTIIKTKNQDKKESLLSDINKLYRSEKWDFVNAMKQIHMKTLRNELLDY